jgi:cytochrome c2
MRSLTVPKTLVEPVLNGVVGREQEGDDILNVIAFLRQHSSYIK